MKAVSEPRSSGARRQRGCRIGAAIALLALAACDEEQSGPIVVAAIGQPPKLLNPNLQVLDAPAAALIEASAQGLVRFDTGGQIEPALAQRWIVSDDGLRYTFRLARAQWAGGGRVTAEQVAARLRAAAGSASKNRLKPLLGAIAEIEPMTEDVLEITLKAPRPYFLQLLAQPEMGLIRDGEGSGPYRAAARPDGSVLLGRPAREDLGEDWTGPSVLIEGSRASLAIARFAAGAADMVTGGTAGDLPIVRVAAPPAPALRFDPVAGLFGLAFVSDEGILGDPEIRRALSMAIDRAAIVAALDVPDLQPRVSLVPAGIDELPQPAVPEWSGRPLADRRAQAERTIAAASGGETIRLRVAMPEGPGYRLILGHLRRDWRRVGVEIEAVEADAKADLRFIDAVAPTTMSTWYLRSFACAQSPVCSPEADEMMERGRHAQTFALRREMLTNADRLLAEAAPFIALAAPVRWHLVSPRLTGFRTNLFGRHPIGELIAERR